MDEKNAGVKDLFKLIVHSPALLITFLVGAALVVYFLVKNGPSGSISQQNASGGISGAQAPTATIIPQTTIVPPIYVPYRQGPNVSATSTAPEAAPVSATVPSMPVRTTPAIPSPVPVSPSLSASARAQMGSASSAGVGIRNQPGGPGTQTTSNVPYGQAVQITGPAVTGGYNNPATPGVANTNQWYPVAGGGYVSAADVVVSSGSSVSQTNSSTQRTTG